MKRGIGESELMAIRAVLTAVIRALPAAKKLSDAALCANKHFGIPGKPLIPEK